MRPTGKLHLGHLLGALSNWVALQKDYQCIFSVADWHALMGEYENSKGLRDYGIAGQIGLEGTLAGFIHTLTAIFTEVRRVLKPDGIFWLNIGDGYTSGNRGWRGGSGGRCGVGGGGGKNKNL